LRFADERERGRIDPKHRLRCAVERVALQICLDAVHDPVAVGAPMRTVDATRHVLQAIEFKRRAVVGVANSDVDEDAPRANAIRPAFAPPREHRIVAARRAGVRGQYVGECRTGRAHARRLP
jgi:hypothetical protein